MFEDDNYYGSINQDKEREQKLMQDRRDRTHKRGLYYFILFWLTILSIPLTFLGSIAGAAEVFLFNTSNVLLLMAAVVIAIGIGVVVLLFLLGKDESCFTIAAIAYILQVLFNSISEFLPDSLFKVVLSLLTMVASLFYLFEFINGSIYILAGVDDYLADSWETLKKIFIYAAVGFVICLILVFIPFISILAILAMIIGVIGLIVLVIWQWVLMFKTARALRNF